MLLSCEHLSVRRGSREVLSDIGLELRAGELVALLGPNGAGKSTLLDALAGSLPAASGTIERHGRIAVALQSGDLARRTARANVTAALAWWGVPRAERAALAGAALSLLGAGHLADRQADSLSGGERRRVHLARAIAVRPDILMLDEPFAGVDAETRSALLEESVSAIRLAARATLVVVHDRTEAWALADRLLILLDGRLVASGRPEDLLERPPTAAVARFLGFDGLLEDGDGILLTRPPHVVIDPDGPLEARVARAIPQEDGVRLALVLEGGTVYGVAERPAPRVGDVVRLRLAGGAAFPREGGTTTAADTRSEALDRQE